MRITPEQRAEIAAAFHEAGRWNFIGAREFLGGKYDSGELRIFCARN